MSDKLNWVSYYSGYYAGIYFKGPKTKTGHVNTFPDIRYEILESNFKVFLG